MAKRTKEGSSTKESMKKKPNTRSRILDTAINLYWRQGLSGTGVQQILSDSNAPKGSLYFHFPGGKQELAVEALRVAGDVVSKSLSQSLLTHSDTGVAVASFVLAFRDLMESSEYTLGCPLATATLEAANSSEQIRGVAVATFATWRDLIAQHLVGNGLPESQARDLAEFAIASIEGALILARANRDGEPLRNAAEILSRLLKAPGGDAPDQRS